MHGSQAVKRDPCRTNPQSVSIFKGLECIVSEAFSMSLALTKQ